MMLTVTQKLALVIVGDRLQWLVESLGSEHEEQNGFCRNRGGTDAVFNLRVGCKKRQEHGLETWVAFLDLIKAFDAISRLFCGLSSAVWVPLLVLWPASRSSTNASWSTSAQGNSLK